MENLILGAIEGPTADERPLEVVERKGLGHPDTICDSLAETLARSLGRLYRERFGTLLHHNVDKILLSGGSSRPRFGGGKVTAPIEIFLVGRATQRYRGVVLPLEDLVHDAVYGWFGRYIPELEPSRHIKVHCLWRPVSADLADLFGRSRGKAGPLANDTSIGTGFAPLSPLEAMVLGTEKEMHHTWVRSRHPEYGPDVKVMGVRRGDDVRLTVPCAFVDRHVKGFADYFAKKRRLGTLLRRWAALSSPGWRGKIGAEVNTADTPKSVYLTVTGTSAEAGDDGEVGRGNRLNGLITPARPMTLEAFSGKNPVTHTGKLYQKAAREIAREVASLEGVRAAECVLVSQIGKPIRKPWAVEVRVKPERGVKVPSLKRPVEGAVHRELERLPDYWKEMLDDPWRE